LRVIFHVNFQNSWLKFTRWSKGIAKRRNLFVHRQQYNLANHSHSPYLSWFLWTE
jgi:hypothetical protein